MTERAATLEEPYVLAIDMGTSSTRALLFDRLGRAVPGSEAQHGYQVRATLDGGVEIDAPQLLADTADCIDGALAADRATGRLPALVAVSCFWHSLLGLDADGEPITPIYMWGDTRSRHAAKDIRAEIDVEAYRQECGVTIHSSYWPAKLRWLRATQPELVSRVRRWVSAADYLARVWQGVDQMSVPMASGTGLLNIHTGDWSDRALEIAAIARNVLPPIVGRAQATTGLTAEWAARWPELAAIPWYPGIGDGACANAGSGAIGSDRLALTLGTSGAVRAIIDAPISQPYAVPDGVWAYRLDERRLVIGAALSNGGNVVAWLSALTGLAVDDASLGEYREGDADRHGLTLLPFLSGERAPLWDDSVTGAVVGVTLATGKQALLRAAMESVSIRLAMLYRTVAPQMNSGCAVIANGGALLGSAAWQRMTADALGVPLTILAAEEETSARGAAVLALEAFGVLPSIDAGADPARNRPILRPDSAQHERYSRAAERQERLTAALQSSGLWER